MNFYQRANLSMGLAVLLALELAISNQIQKPGAYGPQPSPFLQLYAFKEAIAWISFQFLFRVKVTIDDHHRFKKEQNQGVGGIRNLINFLLFSTSTFLFAITAVFSFNFAISSWFFMGGLIVATIWAMVDLTEKRKVVQWIVLNIFYAITIASITYQKIPAGYEFAPYTLLFVLLAADYWISDTYKKDYQPDFG